MCESQPVQPYKVGLGAKNAPQTSRPQGAKMTQVQVYGEENSFSLYLHCTLSPGGQLVLPEPHKVCDSPLTRTETFQGAWRRINTSSVQLKCPPVSHLSQLSNLTQCFFPNYAHACQLLPIDFKGSPVHQF